MTRLFDDTAEMIDRPKFNRTVERSGWIVKQEAGHPASSPQTHENLIRGLKHHLRERNIESSEVTLKGAYSAVACDLADEERIMIVCFPGDKSDNRKLFGVTIGYFWNRKYKRTLDVPLVGVEETMNQFQETLDQSSVEFGTGRIEWLQSGFHI